jgi:hypothetical protein
MRQFCILLFALLAAPASASGVFKCTDATGKVSFTDRPCPRGSDTEAVRIRMRDPNAVDDGSAETRGRRRACAELARPAWDLIPLEAGGRLSDGQSQQLRDTRSALESQCRMRLTSSPLAYDCRERLAELTQATARAVDPTFATQRDRLQAEFDLRCSGDAVLADVEAHLRSLDPEPAPPPPLEPSANPPGESPPQQ